GGGSGGGHEEGGTASERERSRIRIAEVRQLEELGAFQGEDLIDNLRPWVRLRGPNGRQGDCQQARCGPAEDLELREYLASRKCLRGERFEAGAVRLHAGAQAG